MGDAFLEGGDTLVPCDEYVLLWMACASCATSDDSLQLVEKRVGKVDLLKLFEYDSPDAVFDCLNDRLLKPRCQRWFGGLSKAKYCHAMNYDERIVRNKLLIHIGLEPGGRERVFAKKICARVLPSLREFKPRRLRSTRMRSTHCFYPSHGVLWDNLPETGGDQNVLRRSLAWSSLVLFLILFVTTLVWSALQDGDRLKLGGIWPRDQYSLF
jgi:hypothetical protein